MRIVTEQFERDVKPLLIECSAKQRGKPRIRRSAVVIATAISDWKQETFERDNIIAGFRTVFVLYRTKRNYILQVIGESSNPDKFPPRYKVVEFETPQEFIAKLGDSEDNTVYWSPLTEELLDNIQETDYLTKEELQNWMLAQIEEEE